MNSCCQASFFKLSSTFVSLLWTFFTQSKLFTVVRYMVKAQLPLYGQWADANACAATSQVNFQSLNVNITAQEVEAARCCKNTVHDVDL